MVDKVDSLTVENIILIPVWLGFFASLALMFWTSQEVTSLFVCAATGIFVMKVMG